MAAVLFGTTGTAQALGPSLSPLVVGAARIAVGAVLLWIVAASLARRQEGTTPSWPRLVVGLAGACVAGYQLLFFAAVHSTGVAVGTVVALGSAPVFAGLLARATSGARLQARWAACTALATVGVAVLVSGGETGTVSAVGVALALGSGLMYAGYTVGAKRLLDAGHAPEAVMARAFGAGAVLLLPVLVVDAAQLTSPAAVGLAVYLGALPTALAYVLFARGLRVLPAADVATLTLAEPLTAAALGLVVLGEHLSLTAVLGALLILGGLAALATGRSPLPPLSGRPAVQRNRAA
ncbi:MAG: drug/metabolite transporter, family [Thermoleophilaceae bacterium]|nr:drug/metabolite transporter, family [Thermoleophilaceae bacterium]